MSHPEKPLLVACVLVALTVGCGSNEDGGGGTAASGGTGGSAATGGGGSGGKAGSGGTAGTGGASACAPPNVVCAGQCVEGSCDFAVTSIKPVSAEKFDASDWVCGGAFFALQGKGFAKGMRVLLGDGRAPVRVVDPQNAVIVAPPGQAGTVDVTLEIGSNKGRTLAAFTYKTASVEGNSPWQKVTTATPHADVPSIAILPDGRALVSGGFLSFSPSELTAAADLFSLSTSATTPVAQPMHTARWYHATVSLLNGKAVILGAAGVGTPACCDSKIVDLFDPTTDTFTQSAATPVQFYQGPRAILLVDGRVLVMPWATSTSPTALPEIYDPETESFKTLQNAPSINYYQVSGYQFMTRLRDGRILIVLGQGRKAYYFDAETEQFSEAGDGPQAGPDGLFTLPDGRVIAVAGSNVVGGSVPPGDISQGGTSNASNQIELFDPKAGGGFTIAPYALKTPRVVSTVAIERDGSLLVIGGATASFPVPYGCGTPNDDKVTAEVERIDPAAGTVTSFAALPEPNSYLVSATLLDGSVVAAGGAVCGTSVPYPSLYFRKAPVVPR